MSKIRIYEYAKECGVPSKKVIEFLQARNIEVKSHMKSLEDSEVNLLNKEFKKSGTSDSSSSNSGQSKSQNTQKGSQGGQNTQKGGQGNQQKGGQQRGGQGPQRNNRNHKPGAGNRNKNSRNQKPGNKQKNQNQKPEPVKKEVELPKNFTYQEGITVGELAEKIGVDSSKIIKDLFMVGIVANINQALDNDSVELIASDHGFTAELEVVVDDTDLENYFELGDDMNEERPSVVTIMGHVDHGKTTLLDSIRHTKVTAGEAGGITQHIGAYQIESGGKKITFLDTPGHAAFTTMRARGAQVTDITVLVVAADDGVMPQTIEAINHAKAAEVPIIVAVNKMDKPTANPERVMTELGEHGLYPEDWGGDTIFVSLSALSGEGIEDLLEMITLVGEVAELKTKSDRPAVGTVIEAELDKSRGPAASLLVQHGTLKVGDSIVVGNTFGKVRAMVDDLGRRIQEAGPSTPVEITGLNAVPHAGDRFVVFKDDKTARSIGEARSEEQVMKDREQTSAVTLDNLFEQMKEGETKDLNLIIKGDVQGSVEALSASLMKIDVEGVNVRIIHTGVGAINESDVTLASASEAIIIGFNVRPDVNAKKAAEREKVDMRLHRIIYNVIEEIESAMKGMLDPEYEEKVIGNVEVRQTFKVSKVGTIAGAYVTDGKITRDSGVRVIREGIVIYEGELDTLKRFKDDAKEVTAGYECGLTIKNFNDLKEGDQIEPYIMVEIER
ncbi:MULTISPECIES: translation initiation factor IF-2 [Salinicoccus]|jgi:translation initiation factor IF-2|uniref:Translation initiation factor IF-2 n=1 Tax=Salinicoccus roseus TaxID=45670 RepID=A0A265E9T9_9STAP|nr:MULTISPECIES: translation initiation factor IF-2 [Salinicoccus]MCC4722034.1 translation initiation factor IF-2 [Salinicoccus sp. RF5]OZT78344.1 translation initiation factor IF-2 [Salinicoccus roseus]RPE54430.1 translation initiation factor 2 (bIF-2) [Salinicoccus roseus]GGA65596.1 translation initiation factor IF-2 [Salinicoccus roseus]